MFKKRADEQIATLSSSAMAAAEGMDAELNPDGKPKRGSFEITLVRDDGKEKLVWSGLAKGPPRRLKFPDEEELLEAAAEALRK